MRPTTQLRPAAAVAANAAARAVTFAAAAVIAVGCSTLGGSPEPLERPAPATNGQTGGQLAAAVQWPVTTREHVDLWLHGFAYLQEDTTRVPFFERGYRERVVAERKRGAVSTLLDTNRDRLAARFLAFPNLVSAQFLPLYFNTWEELRQSAEQFLRAEGDPRASNDPRTQQVIATFAGYLPTQPDREWLRLFVQSLDDERTKYYVTYWREEQRRRAPTLAAVDSVWARHRPRFTRFVNNAGADRGTILLSLPLDGEGRTLDLGRRNRLVTVGFPDQPSDAIEAVYVFAHEVVSSVTSIAIEDNTTPAEKRTGVTDRYGSPALVRGGAMLLQRIAPDLADGYARYYLRVANVPVTGSDAMAALAAAFPLPAAIRDGIKRQIEVVVGGI